MHSTGIRQNGGRGSKGVSLTSLVTLLLVTLVTLTFTPVSASVIGIDLGTDWFKVSIVKTGIPLDIVLNTESKRKTPAMVAIRNGVRLFGNEAAGLESRFPADTYGRLKNLLGRLYEDPIAVEYRKSFQNNMLKDPVRGTISFRQDDAKFPDGHVNFSVEELVGMILANAKHQAEEFGNETVSGCVITIPPYFNQWERKAVMDAAEIAGLKVYALMNDETAVALNYAMTRNFDSNQYHIFYDMGAGSTVASLVEFSNVVTMDKYKRNVSVPTLTVKAVGYDRTLGGNAFDTRLREMLAKDFTTTKKGKLKGKVTENTRAMTRLLKEANRVKTILSANTETISSVETLFEEQDFKRKVTRTEFETLCKDLFDRVPGPIQSVLSAANLEMKDISSVVLVGGNVRIPLVQQLLASHVGDDKIAKNINGDEAAVLGAGFYAARLSASFRARQIDVRDINAWTIDVSYDQEVADGKLKPYSTSLFPANDVFGGKKLVTFKRQSDFDFALKYSDLPSDEAALYGSDLIHARLPNTTSTIATTKEMNKSKDPKVKALVRMDAYGLVHVDRAYVEVEVMKEVEVDKKDETIGGKIWNFFTGKDGKDKDGNDRKDENNSEVQDSDDAEDKVDTATTSTSSSSSSAKASSTPSPASAGSNDTTTNSTESASNDTAAAPKKEKQMKAFTQRLPLKLDIEYRGVGPLSSEEKVTIRARQFKMDKEDRERYAIEEARNNLEGFVYNTIDFLTKEEVATVTTKKMREEFEKSLRAAGNWLDEEADNSTPLATYKSKLSELVKVKKDVDFKLSEKTKRPEYIRKLMDTIREAKTWVDSIRALNDTERFHTEEELSGLEKSITETGKWLKDEEAKQSKLTPVDTPTLTSDLLKQKRIVLASELAVLKKKRKPRPQTTSSTTTTTVESTTTVASEEMVVPEDGDSEKKEEAGGEGSQKTEEETRDEL